VSKPAKDSGQQKDQKKQFDDAAQEVVIDRPAIHQPASSDAAVSVPAQAANLPVVLEGAPAESGQARGQNEKYECG
jgi:hypothetical protein